MSIAAAATTLPALWTGVIRRWTQQHSARSSDQGNSMTRVEAIAHLTALIRQYEQSQPSYADDLRSALAQLDGR